MSYKKRNSIWSHEPYSWAERSVKQIKSYLNGYKSSYFIELERALSLLDMTRNIFKSSNILYFLNTNKADSFIFNRIWWGKGIIENGSFLIESTYSSGNYFFANINYLTFSLFGIVKMNIYFKQKNIVDVKIF